MKVLVVGASGTIGSAVVDLLTQRGHEVLSASASSKERPVDLASSDSIQRMLATVEYLDAIACAAGQTPFVPWRDADRPTFAVGLENKLLGQIELVREGVRVVKVGGSFTLISGVLAREPVPSSSIASAVNGALEAWTVAAASEMWGAHRLNCVSPRLLTESVDRYDALFPGHPTVSAASVARAYLRSIEGSESGRIFLV